MSEVLEAGPLTTAGRAVKRKICIYVSEELVTRLSAAQLADRREQLAQDLKDMREYLALGDIAAVQDQISDALDAFQIDLDRKSVVYAFKRSHLVALRHRKISASEPLSTWWPGQR